jgi:(p)ppGpp synthase/HD superfamily hydrolase
MLTSRYDEAFRYAHELHGTQKRKGTSIPYISHLMIVSALVIENGGTEDQAIGALLHDAAEDRRASTQIPSDIMTQRVSPSDHTL